MRNIFKALAIILVLATIGQAAGGNFWPIGMILAIIFGYFGWRQTGSKTQNREFETLHQEVVNPKPKASGSQTAKELGLEQKFSKIISKIKESAGSFEITINRLDRYQLVQKNISGISTFTFEEMPEYLIIEWEVNSKVFGWHRLEWSFKFKRFGNDLDYLQQEALEKVTKEISKINESAMANPGDSYFPPKKPICIDQSEKDKFRNQYSTGSLTFDKLKLGQLFLCHIAREDHSANEIMTVLLYFKNMYCFMLETEGLITFDELDIDAIKEELEGDGFIQDEAHAKYFVSRRKFLMRFYTGDQDLDLDYKEVSGRIVGNDLMINIASAGFSHRLNLFTRETWLRNLKFYWAAEIG